MAKVLTTPCIVFIQTLFYSTCFSREIKLCLFVICFGVYTANVNDIEFNFYGAVLACSGVIVGSLYQVIFFIKGMGRI